MAAGDFKFVHSSDWHLEQPLRGLTQWPKELRDLVREAPYRAARQAVELTLVEGAHALVLAGDIVDLAHAGPRAIVFLQEQFERLDAKGVRVFWAGGKNDSPDAWPAVATLPKNVTRFSVGRVEQHDLSVQGKVVARVQGASATTDGRVDATGFHRDAHGVYTLGVAYSTSDTAGKEGDRVHYMALGGRHRRATVDTEPGIAHYSGSPQGRSPDEGGPSGVTLVSVDAGKTTTKFLSTDAVRWTHETLEITAGVTIDQLETRLIERLDKLRSQSQGTDLLVAWHIRGAGPLAHRLRPNGEADELLARLQRRGLGKPPLAYSVSLDCESTAQPPDEWYDQETILGDLLRQIRRYESMPTLPVELSDQLPSSLRSGIKGRLATIRDADHRAALVERAKKLGIDLLTSPTAAHKELQTNA